MTVWLIVFRHESRWSFLHTCGTTIQDNNEVRFGWAWCGTSWYLSQIISLENHLVLHRRISLGGWCSPYLLPLLPANNKNQSSNEEARNALQSPRVAIQPTWPCSCIWRVTEGGTTYKKETPTWSAIENAKGSAIVFDKPGKLKSFKKQQTFALLLHVSCISSPNQRQPTMLPGWIMMCLGQQAAPSNDCKINHSLLMTSLLLLLMIVSSRKWWKKPQWCCC